MIKTKQIETEICVIGGGPAGAAIAQRLASVGHDVCLVERLDFPRPHVGESVPSSIFPILELLGVREEVESASFIRPERAIVRWSREENIVVHAPALRGLLVNRGKFDSILLTAAKKTGVRILQPARALRPCRTESNEWHLPVVGNGIKYDIKAKFLVDAAGRNGITEIKRKRLSTPTLAVFGYWSGTKLSKSETLIEAGVSHWFWGAPVPDDLFVAIVFIDPKLYSQSLNNSFREFYQRLLSTSHLLQKCLHGTLQSAVKVCDASCYYDKNCISTNHIKVGEASFAIDPLSSQGIQTAMQNAVQGAIVVHTLITQADNTDAALEFYRTKQFETVTRFANLAGDYYGQQESFDNNFWQKRSNKISLHKQTEIGKLNLTEIPYSSYLRLSGSTVLRETPIIEQNLIRYTLAVNNPSLKYPVAFLGDLKISLLLPSLTGQFTGTEIVQQWSRYLRRDDICKILQWLWSHNFLSTV